MPKNLSPKLFAILELAMLPAFLYAYGIMDTLFWILLILYDSWMLNHVDMKQLMTAVMKESVQGSHSLSIFSICYLIALGILAFKNIELAGILLVNELLMTLVGFINLSKDDKK